jgi:hypothetical protein
MMELGSKYKDRVCFLAGAVYRFLSGAAYPLYEELMVVR